MLNIKVDDNGIEMMMCGDVRKVVSEILAVTAAIYRKLPTDAHKEAFKETAIAFAKADFDSQKLLDGIEIEDEEDDEDDSLAKLEEELKSVRQKLEKIVKGLSEE